MSRSVLVVDDNFENTYYLETLLAGAGFDVVTARHGAEALALARQAPPQLVISDLLMPVMDGYTLLRHWKADQRLKQSPFIVYTATYTDAEDERLAYDLGSDAFILKPAEPDEFLHKINEVLARTAGSHPAAPNVQTDDEDSVLRHYSETLIRKLEEKTLQLEETNRALAADNEERRRVENALRASEAEFRLLIESIPQIVWVADAGGAAMDFNQRWFDYTGYTREESLGDGWNLAFDPDDRARAMQRWQAATASGESYEVEHLLRRADGTYRWMLSRALPLLDDDGNIVKWLGTYTDIDALKEAEIRIGEQARLLDQAQDAIAVHDREHRILYWNQGAERLHGWTAAEAMGRKASELHCPDTAQLDSILAELERDREWSGELRLIDRNGADLIVEGRWTLFPDSDGGRGAVLVVNTDVTERRRIEAQVLRAQRLESIGTLAGGMAHDLNNLLAPIVVGIDLVRHDGDDAVTRETLDVMATSAHRATELVHQVLSFARGVAGEREQVRVATLLTEFVGIVASTFPADIVVERDVPDDLWDVIGDVTQLHQVLLNLCINARDSMSGGGTLQVRARNALLDEREAAARGATPGRYVVIAVEDDGTGIPAELVDRIFEPFLTTKPSGSGTGLGLSTVIGIVTGHGGVVTVDSEMGAGSLFEVHLPAVTASAEVERDAGDAHRSTPRPGKTVLVVDDEKTIRGLTKRALVKAGYRVMTAGDGLSALETYRTHRDEIGLVLTDLKMPRIDGSELCRALTGTDPELPIIMMSGVVGPAELGLPGVRQVLAKPFSTDQLLTVVSETLGHSS